MTGDGEFSEVQWKTSTYFYILDQIDEIDPSFFFSFSWEDFLKQFTTWKINESIYLNIGEINGHA